MPILTNISKLAVCKLQSRQDQIDQIENAALVWEDEHIVWVGQQSEVPGEYSAIERWDAGGHIVVPGLVDCHTHLAFGGWRQDEFEMRVQGKSYLEIGRAGGGIASSTNATRAASKQELIDKCLNFLSDIAQLGVTTVECKSGYGLSLKDEIKLLEVYRELNYLQPITIVPTLLAAHIVPVEYKENRADYIKLVISEIIPRVAKEQLAKFCDVFVEDTAFTKLEARQILEAASKYGLGLKLHVDQLSDGQGAALAADVGAVSADHLEYISKEGIDRLKQRGTIAVCLPLASLYTFSYPLDARSLIKAGVTVALATDFNPGSAPSYHLPLAMTLGCTLNRLTPHEVLKAATIYAAQAVGMSDTIGSLEVGKQADFTVIDAPDVNHWLYHFRANACSMTVKKGGKIFDRGGISAAVI